MTEPTQSIDHALRTGKGKLALDEARKYCAAKGATRETGIEIARVAAAVYRDLIAHPVHEFAEGATHELPQEVGPLVAKALQRLISMTSDWEKKLWDLHTERLARELRDWVRAKHIEGAAANIARLIALVPAEQRVKRAGYIGNVLATVINNQKEAAQVVAHLARNPTTYKLGNDVVNAIDQSRQKKAGELGSINLENLEREFSTLLTSTAVEIKGLLPEQTLVNEPDETQLRDCGDVFRSILRVPILRQEPDLFMDATALLVEFVPKEQSATAKIARVEGRTYAGLGITAKKAVQRTFMDLGQNRFFCTVYKGWAKEVLGTPNLRPVVELMGAMRSSEFAEFMSAVRSDSESMSAAGGALNQALGSMAGEAAAEDLMTSLRTLLGRKRIENADLKEAERLITSLGAVVKTPRTTDSDRTRIWDFLRTHIPEDLGRLACHSALQCFATKHEVQTQQQYHFAVRALVRGIWASDHTTAHQQGGERQASELGFREEIVQALIKIGGREPDAVAHAADPLAARYGAPYMAAAEVFEKLNNPAFLPILERMLNTTLMHDDKAQSVYQQEYFWDAATQQRKPITKEKLLSPIIFAIGTIGTPAGLAILKRYQEQIAIGKVANPTTEVAGFMAKFLGDNAFAGVTEAAEESNEPVDPSELQGLLKALTKWYILSGAAKRRVAKIQALSKLSRLKSLDSLDTIFRQLVDKDQMVVSAAISCLSDFSLPHQPKLIRTLTIDTTIEQLESKDPAMRVGALKLLKEIGPNRRDVRDKAIAFIKRSDRREIRDAVVAAMKNAGAGSGTAGSDTGSATSGSITSGFDTSPTVPDSMNTLAAKQQYLAARRAWIAGGKKGDPPAKPEGMD
ncbi:hypothetical protein GC173_02715 [bacterium]|nr:hypothetical protein [bacterium]